MVADHASNPLSQTKKCSTTIHQLRIRKSAAAWVIVCATDSLQLLLTHDHEGRTRQRLQSTSTGDRDRRLYGKLLWRAIPHPVLLGVAKLQRLSLLTIALTIFKDADEA